MAFKQFYRPSPRAFRDDSNYRESGGEEVACIFTMDRIPLVVIVGLSLYAVFI